VTTSSLTKCCGFGPGRTGWIFGPPDVLDRAESVEEASCGEPPAVWGTAMASALTHADAALERGRALAAAARPVIDAWVEATPDVSWTPPTAGITGLVRIEGLRDSMTFAKRLRAELDCQVVPGAYFGAEGTIRVSFGLPPKDLQAALDVLALGIPPLRA
jgi:aspartate/methionine/tyrosine aminotransferase